MTSMPPIEQVPSAAVVTPEPDPSTLRLAQALAQALTLTPEKWHRLKSNRQARALEQAAAAIVYLLNKQPEEAQVRLQQAVGWLDRTLTAPPCPTHGQFQTTRQDVEND